MTDHLTPTSIITSLMQNQTKPRAQADTLSIFTTVILFVMVIMIIFGNTLVLVTTWFDKRLHTPNKYFIACLAVADLLVGIFSVPIRLYQHLNSSHIMLLNLELCRFWNWIDISCEIASIITLATISVDRYFKISMPFKYRSLMTTLRSLILISFIWIMSGVYATLGLFSYAGSKAVFVIPWQGCNYDNAIYSTILAFLFFFGPLAVMVVMYALIFHIAHQRKILARKGALGKSFQSRKRTFAKELFQELKTVRMLFLVVITFMICWAPFFTIYLINLYNSSYVFTSVTRSQAHILIAVFFIILPSFNSLCNPIIYACFDREYSKAFRHFFYRLFHCKQDQQLLEKMRKSSSTQSFRLKDRQSRHTSCRPEPSEIQENSKGETTLL